MHAGRQLGRQAGMCAGIGGPEGIGEGQDATEVAVGREVSV